MTDLEKHWHDLPVGPAPVDAILHEARRSSGRTTPRRSPERRLRRSLVTVGALGGLGGLAAAFVLGGVVADRSPGTPGGPAGPGAGGGDATPVAFFGELQAPDSCDDLLQHYVDRGLDLVSEDGWARPPWPVDLDAGATVDSLDGAVPVLPRAAAEQSAAPATTRAESSATGTNVQEAGVDEPDSVKTDGEVLVRLRGAELTTYDVSGAESAGVSELGRLDLGDLHDGEILLTGDRVVAVGDDGTPPDPGEPASPQIRVLTIDLSDPTAPRLEHTVDYDASLVAARQHGDDVRLVLSKGLPDLDFTGPRDDAALVDNRRLVEGTTIDDWLPRVTVDGGEPTDLLSCDRVAVPRADLGLATMAVVGFGADDPGTTDALGLAGDAPLTYESADHLYLASSGDGSDCWECSTRTSGPVEPGRADSGTTHVYDFALDGTGATYVGAGEVEGSVRDRWSMDEADGVLRLAVGPSSETADENAVVTLRADGDRLVEVGRVDGLGVGEQIQSVRWFDGLALLVTYRQVDPLYAVDLTDPAAPRLLGELKIPGFSSYLHPLGSMRVLGVGDDGRGGAQVGLFDVTDLTAPRRLDVHGYGRWTQALAGVDPRQLTWLPAERTVLTVWQEGRTGYLSRIVVAGGRLTVTDTEVERGSDVAEVRTLPLPDGKVALVTGEDVEFFAMD
ncbi:beta-propeller domain-containing protein [Nocardioides litoris]|uniref:beta-propeller domain-containing protein n=1 Tax=Nocardioides litoris TaxID=1926648 RepID=UPI001120B874|nr:beta-propeller domain-containing protein [Nocardioides litoris]